MFIEYMLIGGLVLMVFVIYLVGRHKKPRTLLSGSEEDCHCPPAPSRVTPAPSAAHSQHGHHH